MTEAASIQVAPERDLLSIIRAAGGDPALALYSEGLLTVPGVAQAALDAALAGASSGQAVAAALAARQARAGRDAALSSCDWAVLPDSPLNDAQRGAWVAYRASLRAWPTQPGWPDLPLPTPPG